VIDRREKERLFKDTVAKNTQWLGVIARNNAPRGSWQDLEQEIRIAFWKSLDSYDGERSSPNTWFHSIARNTAEGFQRKNRNSRKRDERVYPNPVFVEQDRDQLRIVEEFIRTLGELDQQVFTMCLDDLSYEEMSAVVGVSEVNLRKRMSRIKEQFKAKYIGR
jgi:RNA polymerase sigma-70 factor (ECF subfamily)